MRRASFRPRLEMLEDRCLLSTVTNLNDSGPGSLRDAIFSTPPGGTVDFQPGLNGTIPLASTLPIAKNLTIRGESQDTPQDPFGPGIKISGNQHFQVFNIAAGYTVVISGLVIENGFSNNDGYTGGNIQNAGDLTLRNCYVYAGVAGFTYIGHPPVFHFGYGGGIYSSGRLTLIDSTVANNFVFPGAGAGIYATNTISLVNSTVTGNFDIGGGTGIVLEGATATFTNSTIASNSGEDVGGIIVSHSQLTSTNSTIAFNRTTDNSRASIGGLSILDTSTATLRNTIVAANTQSSGTGTPDIQGLVTAADHNLIGDGSHTNVVNGVDGNQVGTAAVPIDPRLGSIENNGGFTFTCRPLTGSPAIDAGNNDFAPGPSDQRGFARIYGGTIDIGSVETQRGPAIFAIGGSSGRVQVRRVSDGSIITEFAPYGPYGGPVTVAVGDLAGDGFPDLVTGSAQGTAHVKIFRGSVLVNGFNPAAPDRALGNQVFPFLPYPVGVNVAVGDVFGTGTPTLVVASISGNPHVKVYDTRDRNIFSIGLENHVAASFFAYGLNFNVGANIAVGDVNHDGFADIVTAATAGNPHIKVYSGEAIAHGTFSANPEAHVITQFFAYGLNFNVGAFVAVGDTNGDGFADIITGASVGNPQVKVYDGQAIANGTFNPYNPDASLLDQFFAYDVGMNIGVTVAAADFDSDGEAEILTGARTRPQFRVFPGDAGGNPPALFDETLAGFAGGIYVAA